MSPAVFRSLMRELGLTHGGTMAAELLGVSNRQIFYYLAGTHAVPATVANILHLLLMLRAVSLPPEAVAVALELRPDFEGLADFYAANPRDAPLGSD
jgi:hypothetical protein